MTTGAVSTPGAGAPAQALPELARLPWRPRADEKRLARSQRLWTLSAVAHCVPLLAAAALLAALAPITIPLGLVLVAHAWVIPRLYAARGANVVRVRGGRGEARPERIAVGLLGDLVGHSARVLHGRTGLVLESGTLGSWLVGEAGALLIAPGGRRVNCYCVSASGTGLPAGDRIAHLLLALREDEWGFVTVANLAFSGAPWRLRPHLGGAAREALAHAVAQARRAD